MPESTPPRQPGSTPPRRSAPRQRSAQRPAERGATTDQARLAAYTVLRSVDEGGYANLDLPRELRRRRLIGRDAAFATELTYGTLRMRGRYDPIIALAAGRPVGRIDVAVLDTLRLGAHQLLGMRIPAHAAADETVGLARKVNGAGASGLVNAVMRRISEADLDAWLDRIAPEDASPLTRLATISSHPEWIVTAMRQALIGHGRADPQTVDAELRALLEADNAPAQVTLVARPGLVARSELEAAGAVASPALDTAARWPGGDPGSIAAVRDGRAAVQDEGSQLVALALADAELAKKGARNAAGVPAPPTPRTGAAAREDDRDSARPRERWLDLCAGPGGKAGLLAAMAVERGADLVANELSSTRADLVRATLRAARSRARETASTIEVRVGDGRDVGKDSPDTFDRVLVDAPCTGLGALRRRPEARWRRTPQDLAGLGALQRELLASAIDATTAGGVIAYATCSPHLAETLFVVSDTLKRRRDVTQFDARPVVEALATVWAGSLGDGPGVQLWPHVHGTDAMFLALLRKGPA